MSSSLLVADETAESYAHCGVESGAQLRCSAREGKAENALYRRVSLGPCGSHKSAVLKACFAEAFKSDSCRHFQKLEFFLNSAKIKRKLNDCRVNSIVNIVQREKLEKRRKKVRSQ